MGSYLREQFHSDLRILSIPSPDKSAELLLGVSSEDTLVSMKSKHYIQGVGGISGYLAI